MHHTLADSTILVRKAPPARSLIAAVNALFRAKETAKTNAILSDPFAARFAEHDWRVAIIRLARYLLPPLSRTIDELMTAHCVRHKSVDAQVEAAIADGYRQVVIIGAGYDMRARRLANDRVRWFEVDLPSTMAAKWALLKNEPHPVRYVPMDLNTESLAAELKRAGLDANKKTLFVLEGLVHYLPLARFNALLASLADVATRRRVVLTYIRSDMYAQADGLFIRLVKTLREIPRLHFAPSDLGALLDKHGLQGFRSWTAAEQVSAFAPKARGRPLRLSQDVAVAETF